MSLVDLVILLERVIGFPCLSEYRHKPIPALHIPCTAWNIKWISMIYHFRCCLRFFIYNTCRTSDGSTGGWPTTSAGICKCWGVIITVGVMFFFIHKIYIRRRKLWCLRLTVCLSMYRTLIIQLCPSKDSFPFYGTFKLQKLTILIQSYFPKCDNWKLITTQFAWLCI